MSHDWEYHQSGRDRAATLGAFGILAIVVLVVFAIIASLAWVYAP